MRLTNRSRCISVFLSIILVSSASWVVADIGHGNVKRGSDIYRTLCLRCHGEKLDGHGPDAQDLKMAPANLRSLSSRMKSDWELLIVLGNGVMFTPMHGFRDLLTEQDMKDVLSYIRSEAPFKPLT